MGPTRQVGCIHPSHATITVMYICMVAQYIPGVLKIIL